MSMKWVILLVHANGGMEYLYENSQYSKTSPQLVQYEQIEKTNCEAHAETLMQLHTLGISARCIPSGKMHSPNQR